MEFLVHIEVLWPPDGDPDEKARLVAAEGARARELIAEGRIRRLWRIPVDGRTTACGRRPTRPSSMPP